MIAPSFSDGLRTVILSIVFCTLGNVAVADVGGGKGHPATPWRGEGPKNTLDIEKAKALAARYQTLSIPAESVEEGQQQEWIHLRQAGLAPIPFREDDTVAYEFVGMSSSGNPVALPFSQIESFTVTAKNEETITLRVTVWPEISVEQLLQNQLTYKGIYEGYRKNVVLDVSLKSTDGRPQAFMEEWKEIVLPLSKLPEGTRCGFYEEPPQWAHPLRFWWAVPSVANDEDYPFRLIPLAR